MTTHHKKPLAAEGLTSYRYKGRYGFIMIGANGDAEALTEAQRSIDDVAMPECLERWNGFKYEELQ